MKYEIYAHRFADIILNSDYALKQEIEEVIKGISFYNVLDEFEKENQRCVEKGKRPPQGKQSTINALFRKEFLVRGWQAEKCF